MMTINCGWSMSAKKAIQQRWKHVALRREQLFKQQKWSHQSCWKDKPAGPNSCNFHTIMAWSQHPWHSLYYNGKVCFSVPYANLGTSCSM
jgi:hypothetical protein